MLLITLFLQKNFFNSQATTACVRYVSLRGGLTISFRDYDPSIFKLHLSPSWYDLVPSHPLAQIKTGIAFYASTAQHAHAAPNCFRQMRCTEEALQTLSARGHQNLVCRALDWACRCGTRATIYFPLLRSISDHKVVWRAAVSEQYTVMTYSVSTVSRCQKKASVVAEILVIKRTSS